MACHTPPFKKSKETREITITQPQSHPLIKMQDGMGPRLGNGIIPVIHNYGKFNCHPK